MSAHAPIPRNNSERIRMALGLWVRTTATSSIFGDVAKGLPKDPDPDTYGVMLGQCCRLVEWGLLETGYSLEILKESRVQKPLLPVDAYLSTCHDQEKRMHACLATAKAIKTLLQNTEFEDEKLLLAAVIPDLDEQIALINALRAGALGRHSWESK